jgi:hypothetical protein
MIMKQCKPLIICFLAALYLAGCSSLKNILSEEIFNKAGTEWVDSKDKPAIVLGQAELDDNSLIVPVECHRVKIEVAFDEYYWKPYSFKGTAPQSSYHRKNVRPTGAQRKEATSCPAVDARLLLTGHSSRGKAISPSLTAQAGLANGRFAFPIKALAETLARQPATLGVTVTVVHQPNNFIKATLSPTAVAAMKLQSENWLSSEALTTLLMTRIVAALKTNDYQAALPWFRKLEVRGKNLSQGFYYYHIAALAGAGDMTGARARVDAYVKKYGKRGKYYAQVTELMRKNEILN